MTTLAIVGTETLGPIEVLQYSPLPQKDFMRPIMETTPAGLVGPVEFSIYGPVAAVHQVVPGMRFLGKNRGTSIAFAGETDEDPEILAGILWDLHAKRDRFRVEVATG
jgi:hypothetical protein